MARKSPRGSWPGAVFGLALLGVLAFGVGAFAGLVWKEPGLLVAYVRGDTTEVAWSTAAADLSPAEAPPVAAAAPPDPEPASAPPKAPDPEPASAPAKTPEPEASPAPAVASAPPPRRPAEVAKAPAAPPPSRDGRIAVQVGAFAARDAAEGLRTQLSGAGFPAYLAARTDGGDPWRVRVGPFDSRDEAGRVARRLERAQQLPTWILDEAAE